MKHILLATAVLFFGCQAGAQDSLFPELKNVQTAAPAVQPAEQPAPAADTSSESVTDNQTPAQAESAPVPTRPVNPNPTPARSNTPGNQDDKKSGPENLIIELSDGEIVVPTVEYMQFCTAKITLYNNTKQDLDSLAVVFDYTPYKVPYTFSGIPAGESAQGNVALMGKGCQSLLREVNVTVTSCKLGDWTEAQCKNKLTYRLFRP